MREEVPGGCNKQPFPNELVFVRAGLIVFRAR
jgi:hypothetical protein